MPPEQGPDRARLEFLLAVVLPASLAAAAVVLTANADVAEVEHPNSAAVLARLAETLPATDAPTARLAHLTGLPDEDEAASTPLARLEGLAGEGVAGRGEPTGPADLPDEYASAATRLANLAGLPPEKAAAATPLRPMAARQGEAALGAEPLESPAGGIRPAPPARIAIPAAGVDAPVQRVASVDDALEIPPVGRAGWFDGGARPGEPGRAVLIGHLDSREGPGLFARVPKLPPGAPIAVTDRRGDVHRFRAVGGSQVKKEDFPTEYVYGHSDRPVLVLITCGGPYTKGEGYRDNVLLYARSA